MDQNVIGEADGETLVQAHVTGTPYTPRGRSKQFPRATLGSRREGYFHLATDGKERRLLDALDGDRWRLEFTSATLLTLVGLGDDQAGGAAGFIALDGLIHRWTVNPTLGNGGLAASTEYRIYVFVSGGVVTLEASTTAPAPAAGYDIYSRKTADATRVLVGLIKTNASSQFYARGIRSIRHDPIGNLDLEPYSFEVFGAGTFSIVYDTVTSRLKRRRTSSSAASTVGQLVKRFQLPWRFGRFPAGALRIVTRASEILTSTITATLFKGGVADAGVTAVSIEPTGVLADQAFELTPTGSYLPGEFLTLQVDITTTLNTVTHDLSDFEVLFDSTVAKVGA